MLSLLNRRESPLATPTRTVDADVTRHHLTVVPPAVTAHVGHNDNITHGTIDNTITVRSLVLTGRSVATWRGDLLASAEAKAGGPGAERRISAGFAREPCPVAVP